MLEDARSIAAPPFLCTIFDTVSSFTYYMYFGFIGPRIHGTGSVALVHTERVKWSWNTLNGLGGHRLHGNLLSHQE